MKKIDALIKILVIIVLIIISASSVFYFIWRPYSNEKRIKVCTKNALNRIDPLGEKTAYDDIEKINKLCSMNYWQDKIGDSRVEKCNFEITNLTEHRGEYGKNQDGYIVYEGVIKNNSTKEERLKAMIVKMYDKNKVYISEGYTGVDKKIEPGEQYPFKLHLLIKKKEYLNDQELIKNIYPWFATCE